jgi:signal transduction histidine kinase/DNA-binding response OmpR family regulator/HPt (histidine-containing phosphotransfer) domain-containing protein
MQRPTRLFMHFLMLAAPATAIILAGVFFYGQLEIKREIGELELYEASELSLSGAATQQNLGAITSDMEFLSALYGQYSTSESPSPANLDALADNFATFMNSHGVYRQIGWIDETGMERLRITFDQSKKQARRVSKSELQNKSDRYYFVQANQIAPGTIYLSPFDLEMENGVIERPFRPTLRIAKRVIDSSNRAHGILILNYDGNDLTNDPALVYGDLQSHLVILNESGYWLKGQKPEDEWGFMFGHKETFGDRYPETWRHIQDAEKGQVELVSGLWTWVKVHPLHSMQLGEDFTNYAVTKPTLISVVGSNQYTWIIATQLPTDQLSAIRLAVWLRLGLATAVLLVLVMLASYLLARSRGIIGTLNAELFRRAEEAEAAGRAKANFLANMSHEIRTPMNAVLGFAYLLEKRSLGSEELNLVRKINVAGQTLLGIINNILDFSKIGAGQLQMEQAPFRLGEVLDGLASIMSANLGGKDIELVMGAVPPGAEFLKGDMQRLSQILINLTGNAIKFTEHGEVTVLVAIAASQNGQVTLRFSVHDTGIGIPLEKQKEIFSAFSQADTTITRRFGGTGLGLAISELFVHLMGGEIGVNSEPGKGSEFWFVVSFETVRSLQYAAPEMVLQHVLVADDNEAARDMLAASARSLGWSVEAVASGEAAFARTMLQVRRDAPFDVLLLDWRMPGMDGLATGKAVREALAHQTPPLILMVTAFARADLLREPGASLVDAILEKPVTASRLYNSIAEAKLHRSGGLPLAAAKTSGRRLLGLRILVVDDSEINCEVTRRILEPEGASVDVVDSGKAALELLDTRSDIDAVLMDVQMPVMDGYEVTRRIRELAGFAKLPIIAVTAGVLGNERDAALGAGMNAFIAKPFNVDEMIDVLQQLSGCKGEPEQAQAETQEVPPTVSGVSLPVLDIEAGLRTWRDEAAYKKYLRRFASTDGQCGRQVAVLLEQGRSSEASAITHRLKGSSGALAMAQVEHVSRLLDERVLSGGAPENLPEQLQTALDIALDAIKDYAGSASEDISASRIDTAASGTVGPLLAEMLRALDRDNPDEAESILASLAKEVPEEMLRGICERVEAFDFRAAEAQVKALAGKLEISV